jgi:hypothetical protein
MSDMERLLWNLSHLKLLKLRANGNADLADGQRWQALTSGLVTFDFMFELLFEPEWEALGSFCTPFWLDEKHWHVACEGKHLFSVPHFANIETDEDFLLPLYSTAPDDTVFYERVVGPLIDSDHYFTHVQTLDLRCSILLSILQKTVDLSQVQHLILPSSMDNSMIERLLNEAGTIFIR